MTVEARGKSEEDPRVADPPVGYTIVLPPAWRKIPVRQGTEQAIRAIVDQAWRNLPTNVPRDKVAPYRKELERQLASAVRQARRSGAVDLYLPVELMHGAPIAASFIVSEGSLGSVTDIEPEMIISYLASGRDDNRAVTVDGAIGVRLERTARPDQSQGIEHGSRRVDYAISVPAEADRWVVVAFSTLGGGDPDDQYATILVELFDAIMSTFRWRRA